MPEKITPPPKKNHSISFYLHGLVTLLAKRTKPKRFPCTRYVSERPNGEKITAIKVRLDDCNKVILIHETRDGRQRKGIFEFPFKPKRHRGTNHYHRH